MVIFKVVVTEFLTPVRRTLSATKIINDECREKTNNEACWSDVDHALIVDTI